MTTLDFSDSSLLTLRWLTDDQRLWCRNIRSFEKFRSFYTEIMDAQHFSFYIILSNYVWSILFCQNRFHVVWRCIVVKDVSAKEKHNLIYWWPLGLSKFSDPFGLLAFPLYCLCCLYVGDDFRGAIIETKEASGKRIVMPRPNCISRRTKETKH